MMKSHESHHIEFHHMNRITWIRSMNISYCRGRHGSNCWTNFSILRLTTRPMGISGSFFNVFYPSHSPPDFPLDSRSDHDWFSSPFPLHVAKIRQILLCDFISLVVHIEVQFHYDGFSHTLFWMINAFFIIIRKAVLHTLVAKLVFHHFYLLH